MAEDKKKVRRTWWRYILPPWWIIPYYAVILATLYLFADLAQGVYAADGFPFDSVILEWLYNQQSRFFTSLALILNYLAISYALGAVILIAAVLLWNRSRRSSVFLVLSFWGAVGVNLVAKEYFERVRPDLFEQLTPITNSSFPSGHAMGSFAFGLAIFFVVHHLRVRAATLWGVLALLFAVIVGISRNYLQVHYPSDVLAGWALSTAWVMGVGSWYTYGYRSYRRNPKDD